MLDYEKDPAAIYKRSFSIVRSETALDGVPGDLESVVIRLVHACGMTDIANDLAFSEGVAGAAAAALVAGKPVLCDCEMVKAGIIRTFLPETTELIVTLNDESVPQLARELQTTRSAAAVSLWRNHIEGAVVVIGNAPTALFQLLEFLDEGWPRPAAILAFPVGFVGAAESKAELAANPRKSPFLTLCGRRGGSAMASAALNAVSAALPGSNP